MASTVAVLGTLLACTAACLDSDARTAEISDSTVAPASLAAARVTHRGAVIARQVIDLGLRWATTTLGYA
jgi:hypothetical protein